MYSSGLENGTISAISKKTITQSLYEKSYAKRQQVFSFNNCVIKYVAGILGAVELGRSRQQLQSFTTIFYSKTANRSFITG